MRGCYGAIEQRPQHSGFVAVHPRHHRSPGRSLVLHRVDRFGTIKKLPTRLAPYREVVKRYRSSLYSKAATSSTSLASTRSLKSTSIRHLLSMKPRANRRGLALCFARVTPDMQPRKEATSVYTEVA